MPKQPSAEPVVGGQINPQVVESLQRRGAYASQGYLQAMEAASRERIAGTQAGAQIQTAQIGAASRERTAAIQSGTTKQVAAMQQSAEDERAARGLQDRADARQLQLDIFQKTEQFASERDALVREQKLADEAEDRARLEKANAEIKLHTVNESRFNRAKRILNQKIIFSQAAASTKTREEGKKLELTMHDGIRARDRETGIVDSVKEQAGRIFDSSDAFTHESLDKEEFETKVEKYPSWKGIELRAFKYTKKDVAPERITEVSQEMADRMMVIINEEVGEESGGTIWVMAPRGDVDKWIRSKRIGKGELFAAVASMEGFRDKMLEERDSLAGSQEPVQRAAYKAYGKAVRMVDEKISEITGLQHEYTKTNQPEFASLVGDAMDIAHGEGLYSLLSALTRNAPRPMTMDEIMEAVEELATGMIRPEFAGETKEQFEEDYRYMITDYNDMAKFWFAQRGMRGAETPQQILERVTREAGIK